MYTEPTNNAAEQSASTPRRHSGPRRPQQTPLARRRRLSRMIRNLASEAGIAAPSTAERVMLEQVAVLTMRAADLRAAIERGEVLDGDELIRNAGEQRRLLAQLRKRAPQPKAPTLAEYLNNRTQAPGGEVAEPTA